MSDETTTLAELKALVERFEVERDWRQFHAPKNPAMGAAIEAAELMEHFLWLTGPESEQVRDDAATLAEVGDEIADVFCYLLNLAVVLELDLSDALRRKLQANAEKYPAADYRGKYKL